MRSWSARRVTSRQPVPGYFPSVFVPAGFGQLFGVHGVDFYAVNTVDVGGIHGTGAHLLETSFGQREVALAGTGGTFGVPQQHFRGSGSRGGGDR